ncbi:head-tail adaptor Ad3 [Vibrio phage PVA1]|uniref:head-tail adaptor Ad3 n=1 Tax=Vibrio phage PVA1 TaxID=1461743 RepID=UPI0003F21463|nr:head-tail adaptor Ad3 [Vibrio phage PVA1]AHJ87858.1 DNA stabilization protein [Vibrio phage PVA1]
MAVITKGEIVDMSLDFLALSGALINPSPSTRNKFLRFLEVMVPSWTNRGLSIGYKLSPNGLDPDADEDSGIVVDDSSAVALNLAVMAAGSAGLMATPDLKHQAEEAYAALFAANPIKKTSNPYMPEGTGASYDGRAYYQPYEENVTVENNGTLGDLTI